jgi:hypothetical protein
MTPFHTFPITVGGRELQIRLSVGLDALNKSQSEWGIDLITLLEDQTQLEPLLGTMRGGLKLGAMLFDLCEEQLTKANVTPEQFGLALAGDAMTGAIECLGSVLADFIPSPEERAKVLGQLRLSLRASEAGSERVSRWSETLQQEMKSRLATMSIDEIDRLASDETATASWLRSMLGSKTSADGSDSPIPAA